MEEGVVSMIRIENLTKSYPSKMGPQYIFKNLNFDFPTENNVAILGKNNLSKNGFTDHISLTYENYNYEDEFYSIYNNELEKACADFTDVYRKSFRTVEKCYYIKYNNNKAFNLMGKSSKYIFYYQVYYLFKKKN